MQECFHSRGIRGHAKARWQERTDLSESQESGQGWQQEKVSCICHTGAMPCRARRKGKHLETWKNGLKLRFSAYQLAVPEQSTTLGLHGITCKLKVLHNYPVSVRALQEGQMGCCCSGYWDEVTQR